MTRVAGRHVGWIGSPGWGLGLLEFMSSGLVVRSFKLRVQGFRP